MLIKERDLKRGEAYLLAVALFLLLSFSSSLFFSSPFHPFPIPPLKLETKKGNYQEVYALAGPHILKFVGSGLHSGAHIPRSIMDTFYTWPTF